MTNPACFDDGGLLRVRRLVEGEGEQGHGCGSCAVNMCKGIIVDGLLPSVPADRIAVYVGDGRNDFCPAKRLRRGDVVLPRAGMALDALIKRERESIVADVRVWETYEQLEEIIAELISPSHG